MADKLFLGIADNNQFAMAVVGDSTGKIIATCVGDSVNHYTQGVFLARKNFQDLVAKAIGWQARGKLERICFTYKSKLITTSLQLLSLIDGIFKVQKVQVVDFAKSGALGIHTSDNQLFLTGGEAGLVVFQAKNGLRFKSEVDPRLWNLEARLRRKINGNRSLDGQFELRLLLERKTDYLEELTLELESLANRGNPLALELLYDIAYDLVVLVVEMSRNVPDFNPIIGLYGSILLGSKLVSERVRYLVELLFPQAPVVVASTAPATGAYLAALQEREAAPRLDEFILPQQLAQKGLSRHGVNGSFVGKNNYQRA